MFRQEYTDDMDRQATRREIRMYEERQRARRRALWWAEHREGLLAVGFAALCVAAVAFTILVRGLR